MTMRTAKYFFNSVFFLLFAVLVACSTTASDPAESYKGETGAHIFKAGEEALRDKSYAEAIKRFEALDAQYPYGQDTELAQLHIIYAYYMTSEYLSAEAAADRFIHAHPANPHVDYAYYMRGLANYYQNMGVFERLFTVDFSTRDLAQVKKSFNDFSELNSRFPNSAYAAASHQYMIYLRNVLANHQLEVAQYYYSREAYVAAVDRASIVIQNYQGAPAIPQALVMMIKSYHQLHQTKLENETMAILRYNFPNSIYVEEAVSEDAKPSSVLVAPGQRLHTRTNEPVVQQTPVAKPPVVTTTSQATPFVPVGNGARGAKPVALGSVIDSTTGSGFFTLHKKPARVVQAPQKAVPVVTPAPSSQQAQAETAEPTQVLAAANTNVSPQAPAAVAAPATQADMYPYKANGLR